MESIIVKDESYILTNRGYILTKDITKEHLIAYFDENLELKFTKDYKVDYIKHKLTSYKADINASFCIDVPNELDDKYSFTLKPKFKSLKSMNSNTVKVSVDNNNYIVRDIHSLAYKFLFLCFANIDVNGKYIYYSKYNNIRWFNYKFVSALSKLGHYCNIVFDMSGGELSCYTPTFAISAEDFYSDIFNTFDRSNAFIDFLIENEIIVYFKEGGFYNIQCKSIKIAELIQLLVSLNGFTSYMTSKLKYDHNTNTSNTYYQVNMYKDFKVKLNKYKEYTNCSCAKITLNHKGTVPIFYNSSYDRKCFTVFIKNY